MATTEQNLQAIHASITTLGTTFNGHAARAQRDKEVITALERIKQSAGTDKEKYITNVIGEAKAFVAKNHDDLAELKRLRGSGPEDAKKNADQIQALFVKNPDLIKARAYLVLGAGLTRSKADSPDAAVFAELIDTDVSTNTLIGTIDTVAKSSYKDIEALHKACTDAAKKEMEAILVYLKAVEERKTKEAEAHRQKIAAADQAILDTYGIVLDAKGKITEIKDGAKAKALSTTELGEVKVGDTLNIFFTEIEKGHSVPECSASGSDKEAIGDFINLTKGKKIGVRVVRDGKEAIAWSTAGSGPGDGNPGGTEGDRSSYADLGDIKVIQRPGGRVQVFSAKEDTRLGAAMKAQYGEDIWPAHYVYILSVNGKPIASVADLQKALQEADPTKEMSLSLEKNGRILPNPLKVQPLGVSPVTSFGLSYDTWTMFLGFKSFLGGWRRSGAILTEQPGPEIQYKDNCGPLKKDDVIQAVLPPGASPDNGWKTVDNAEDLHPVLFGAKPGQWVTLKVKRGDTYLDITVAGTSVPRRLDTEMYGRAGGFRD